MMAWTALPKRSRRTLARKTRLSTITFTTLLSLGGCASPFLGPTVEVKPSADKPFATFQDDQAACERYAAIETSTDTESANKRAVEAIALETHVGTPYGVATGNGRGTALQLEPPKSRVTIWNARLYRKPPYEVQQRYNIAYMQCMYSKGNRVPQFALP